MLGKVKVQRSLIVVFIGGLLPFSARAEVPQAQPAPQRKLILDVQGPQPERISVLVFLDEGTDRGPIRAFTRNKGGKVKYEYNVVMTNVMNLRNIPVVALAALERIPGVQRVEEDEYIQAIRLDEATAVVNGLQSQISAAGFSADGTGVRVCVCDTGIDTNHIMYADRIDFAAGFDFHNNDSLPEDDNGHGAHVSGIAVGGTGLTVDFGCEGPEAFQGMAPNATLIGVKILDRRGAGFTSNIIAGINHCADPNLPGGQADVINLSIGTGNFAGPCDSHSWAMAANDAVAAGVVVVAASGNECNNNSMGSPACGSSVISVGATYNDDFPNCEDSQSSFNWGCCSDSGILRDDIVCFSNQSDDLDVAAPGAVIWSASIGRGNDDGTSITTLSGTSMASPMVTGLVALILDADGSLTPAQVRQIIRDGAVDLGSAGFDRAYGHGRIDAIGSLSLVGPGCTTNADCDDADACTTDVCNSGNCSNTPINCDDGNACTADSCSGGSCFSDPISCDDADACTIDSCDVGLGCINDPINCDDGNVCTADSCSGGVCFNDPLSPCCGDGVCDGGEDQCSCSTDCGAPPATETNCTDGIDNDCNQGTDCADPDCSADPACDCGAKQATCTSGADCCSGICKRNGTCR